MHGTRYANLKTSKGLLLLWNNNKLSVQVKYTDAYLLQLLCLVNSFNQTLVNIYCSNHHLLEASYVQMCCPSRY